MTALAIDKIEIQGFRGLAKPLPVDLRSPLTVLYAPNGTGKTTICDAAEWVVTGKVARLCVGPSFDETILRPKFDNSFRTEVTAHIRINGSVHRVRRRIGELCLAEGNGNWHPVNLSDLLEKLAPEGAGKAHYKRTIHQRQEYIRGTRFLSSDTLAILLDPEAEDRRQEIFSDLLGTRHLLEAENKLEKLKTALKKEERRLVSSFDSITEELADLERAGLTAPEVPARASIEAAERLLNLQSSDAALETRVQQVVGAIAGQRQQYAQRRLNIAMLRVQIPQISDLQRNAAEAENGRKAAEATSAKIRPQLVKLQEEAASIVGRRQGLRARVTDLAEGREQLKTASSSVLVHYGRLGAEQPGKLSLSQSFARTRDWELSDDARQVKRAAVQALSFGLPEYRRRRAELEIKQGELITSTTALEIDAELKASRGSTVQDQARLRELRRRLEVEAEPVQRLQMLARELAAHEAHGTDCPACGHDWETTDLLRRALETISERTPASLEAIERQIAVLEKDLSAQNALEVEAAAREEAHQVLTGEISRLISSCAEFEQNAARWLTTPVPDEADHILQRLLISLDLADALRSLDKAQGLIGRFVSFDTEIPLEDASAAALTSISNLLAASSASLGELEASHNAILYQIQDAEQQISAADAAARAYETQEAQARNRLDVLTQSWSALGISEPINRETLEKVSLQDEGTEASLLKAEVEAEAARASAELEARLVVASRKREKRSEVSSELERLQAQLQSTSNALLAFSGHAAVESKARISGLTASVNAIFSRLHSNRVIDEISLGEATLYWAGGCGAERIEPPEFSHGQRQDLALALFLARARSIGGSFILDEPMAHLDDLNRVGLIDVFRSIAIEQEGLTNVLVTTASRSLTRHLAEKFARVGDTLRAEGGSAMRVVELEGNTRSGVNIGQ
ncbi:AAA family ATPase [Sphingorhabdus soli]|uniref:AAA family ATPase n=1 Tax=Flavisphingopyxis soli TaxID=2601267 RepID=A0A5C6UM52_9SPHN|nr:AAA family ATPase [Sphingorhabdus soli]TXC74322.1 AAA family ATPase [Sphingorhabdus soli]